MSSKPDKYCDECCEYRNGKFCCECGSKLSEFFGVKVEEDKRRENLTKDGSALAVEKIPNETFIESSLNIVNDSADTTKDILTSHKREGVLKTSAVGCQLKETKDELTIVTEILCGKPEVIHKIPQTELENVRNDIDLLYIGNNVNNQVPSDESKYQDPEGESNKQVPGDESNRQDPEDESNKQDPDVKSNRQDPEDESNGQVPEDGSNRQDPEDESNRQVTEDKSNRQDSEDASNRQDPEDESNRQVTEDKSNRQDSEDASNRQDPEDESNKQDPDVKSNRQVPEDGSNRQDPEDESNKQDPEDESNRQDPEDESKKQIHKDDCNKQISVGNSGLNIYKELDEKDSEKNSSPKKKRRRGGKKKKKKKKNEGKNVKKNLEEEEDKQESSDDKNEKDEENDFNEDLPSVGPENEDDERKEDETQDQADDDAFHHIQADEINYGEISMEMSVQRPGEIRIHFYVIFLRELKDLLEEYNVQLALDFRNWNLSPKMKEERTTKDGDILFHVEIKTEILPNYFSSYKYVLVPKDMKKQKNRKNWIWEQLHIDNNDYNRVLNFQRDDLYDGLSYQVDDVILVPVHAGYLQKFRRFIGAKSVFDKVKDWHKSREKAFPIFFNLCERKMLPLAGGKLANLMFKKALFRGFFKSSKEIHHYASPWCKISRKCDVYLGPFQEISKHFEDNITKMKSEAVTSDKKIALNIKSLSHAPILNEVREFCDEKLTSLFFQNLSIEYIHGDVLTIPKKLQEEFGSYSKYITFNLLEYWKFKVSSNLKSLATCWCYPLVLIHLIYKDKKGSDLAIEFPSVLDSDSSGLHGISSWSLNFDFIDETFANLHLLKKSLLIDEVLQLSLLFVMRVWNLPYVTDCVGFRKDFIVKALSLRMRKQESQWTSHQYLPHLNVVFVTIQSSLLEDNSSKDLRKLVLALCDFLISFGLNIAFDKDSTPVYLSAIECTKNTFQNLKASKNKKDYNDCVRSVSDMSIPVMNSFKAFIKLNHEWTVQEEQHILCELKFFDSLLNLNVFSDVERVDFRDLSQCVSDLLAKNIDNLSKRDIEKFLNIYGNLNSYKLDYNGVIQRKCEDILHDLFNDQHACDHLAEVIDYLQKGESSFIRTLLNEWNKRKSNEQKLDMVLRQPLIREIFKFFCKDPPDHLETIVKTVKDILKECVQRINDGNLSLDSLEYIITWRNPLENALKAFLSDEQVVEIAITLQTRIKEMENFALIRMSLEASLDFCGPDLVARIGALKVVSKQLKIDTKEMALKDIKGYFKISDDVSKCLISLNRHDLLRNHLYSWFFWSKQGPTTKGFLFFLKKTPETLKRFPKEMTLNDLFINPLEKLFRFFEEVIQQDITKSTVEAIFGGIKKDIKSELNSILKFFKANSQFKNVSEERVTASAKRIESVVKARKCREIAELILTIKEELGLRGDFSSFDQFIKKVVFKKHQRISSINETFVHDILLMYKTKLPLSEVLKAMKKNMGLIKWLRQTLEDENEIRASVEVMKNAADENNYLEINLVRYFEEICSAFVPVLFWLGKQSGWDELQKACERVKKNVGSNQSIFQNMAEVAKSVNWFKYAYNSQTSFTKGALIETKYANRTGRYIIGKNDDVADDDLITTTATLSRVFNFEITNQLSEQKIMSLSDVNDLQSRLVLLGNTSVGEGNEKQNNDKEIEFFLKHADLAKRLGEAYVSLCEAGDVKYFDWSYEFRCNIDEEVVFLNVNEEIQKLEKRLEVWEKELTDYRSKFPLANLYTNKQCLALRKYISPLKESVKHIKDLPLQVFTLLKMIYRNVNLKDVEDAFYGSYLSDSSAKESSWQHSHGVNDDSNFILLTRREILNNLNDLIDEFNIDETLAKASFMHIIPFDIDRAIIWCNNQRPDSENNQAEDDADLFDKEIDQLCEESDSEEDHIQPELDQYLELNQLGQFLAEIKKLSRKPKRRLPSFFKGEERVSLLVVPRAQVLKAVGQIYLNEGDFPDPGEILLCNDDPSFEKVDLFMRSVKKGMERDVGLYCLAFADYLSYNLCEKVLESIRDCNRQVMNHLIVICSEENENHSKIHSALESYRDTIVIIDDKSLLNLLSPKLRDENQTYASMVDKDKFNVRIIKSERGGMGKTMYVKEKEAQLEQIIQRSKAIRKRRRCCSNKDIHIVVSVHEAEVKTDDIVDLLCTFEECVENIFPRIYHFDVAPLVSKGLDNLIFNVAILGCLQTKTGKVWRKNDCDLCIFEITQKSKEVNDQHLLNIIPSITCCSPLEVRQRSQRNDASDRVVFDKLLTEPYQRVYGYLMHYALHNDLSNFFFVKGNIIQNDERQILELLITKCGIEDPSWLELQNFVFFFNKQLEDYEFNIFAKYPEDFPGFKTFVVKFMLLMAKDFSTRSLEENEGHGQQMVELRRLWEQNFHPYLFFNEDRNYGTTFSFFGFLFAENEETGNMSLIDPSSGQTIQHDIMSRHLFDAIQNNMANDIVNLETNVDELERDKQLILLARVLGIEDLLDPDDAYELTTDNMKKIMAIHMRQRCGIPVVLMGETGCGKTRLIKFISLLRAGGFSIQNMFLIKIHGGITAEFIEEKIGKVKEIVKENVKKFLCHRRGINYDRLSSSSEDKQSIEEEIELHFKGKKTITREDLLRTVVFLDEANTSEAIGLIKEIMIDGNINGKPCNFDVYGIDVIAACNPYRRHTKEMLDRLKSGGLGYHVPENKSNEKFGDIPLRHLVYRVHSLPESMRPLVWDFGTLSNDVERRYSKQIIDKCIKRKLLPNIEGFKTVLLNVLTKSQEYMKTQKSECSFVSLRDIERAVTVTSWFFNKMDLFIPAIHKIETTIEERDYEETQSKIKVCVEKLRRSLVLAVAVCYIAKLEERQAFIEMIKDCFTGQFALPDGAEEVRREIKRFQDIFVGQLDLKDNIAKNTALCENIFMMVVCIELRIPLFIIGKPGSSKSLAKTIIQDNMQGSSSKSTLFSNFKRITMTSYQCSPHSTSEGIIGVFKQAAIFQEDKNLEEYTSVVVLDEVGLAEDSPKMPLKALHPLLEDGTDGSEDLTLDGKEMTGKRVSFVGISNWALDPAKMNRGILLSRSPPDEEELYKTACDICAGNDQVKGKILPILKPLAQSYFELYENQKENETLKNFNKEEFFGLRDFYSLVKMIFCLAKSCQNVPTLYKIQLAVKRNFSGLEKMDPWHFFENRLIPHIRRQRREPTHEQGPVSTFDMLDASLETTCPCSYLEYKKCSSSRYLLVMTENYSALPMIENLLEQKGVIPKVIFGSSFSQDQEFTQVCRDINRMKISMEAGETVILLNMEQLYESLYDALNQYYVYLGGQGLVDLGLGTHRVKCRVHENFRLIVIANKDVVYKKFPIPLINRLEKHFLMMSSGLNEQQKELSDQLEAWARDLASVSQEKAFTTSDAFVGFNNDTCPSIVMNLSCSDTELFEAGKRTLLNMATPDAICRIGKSKLQGEREIIATIYFQEQQHACLADFINAYGFDTVEARRFIQISTFSSLLSSSDDKLKNAMKFPIEIQVFDILKCKTEFDFRQCLDQHLQRTKKNGIPNLLIIQHAENEKEGDIVACAQYICREKLRRKMQHENIFIMFLVQLNPTPRAVRSSVGYHLNWECVHIDDIRSSRDNHFSLIEKCIGRPLSQLFQLEEAKQTSVIDLVQNSIQPALKTVNETRQMDPEVISKKITIIQEFLQDTTRPVTERFSKLVLRFMQKRIEDDELLNLNPNNWLLQALMSDKDLNRHYYGTFQAAVISFIENKISLIWEEFLRVVDQNNNLLLLEDEDFAELWMDLLELVITDDNVKQTRVERHDGFKVSFPFSNFVFESFKVLIKERRYEIKGTTINDFHSLEKILDDSIYKKFLKDLSPFHVNGFATDLLACEFPNHDRQSYEVLNAGLLIGIQDLRNVWERDRHVGDDEDNSVGFSRHGDISVLIVMMSFHSFQEQLRHTSKMLELQPDIAIKVLRDLENQGVMIVDLQALHRSLLLFQPTNEQARRREISISGNDKMKEIKTIVVEMMKELYPEDQNSAKSRLFAKCRSLWTQLRVLQLYEINLCPKSDESESLEKEMLFELWKVLRECDGELSTVDSWKTIEEFLQMLLQENANSRNRSEKKASVQRQCAQFYLDIVDEFCFSQSNSNKGVIQRIMGHTFSNNRQQTKRFSPIDSADADKQPIIRSFILQQLMRRNVPVESYLEQCLQDNLAFARGNEQDIWSICKLFINCYEDCQSSDLAALKGKKFVSDGLIRQLAQMLSSSIRFLRSHPQIDRINVELLKSVGRARGAIAMTCQLLHSVFLDGTLELDKITRQKLQDFFPHLRNVVTNPPNTDVHLFTLRQIIFEHGNRELKELVRISQYDWLNLHYDRTNQPAEVSSDKFLVYGEAYKTSRNQISQIILRNNPQNLENEVVDGDDFIIHLALMRELNLTNSQPNNELLNAIALQYRAQEILNARQTLSGFLGDRDVLELLYHFHYVIRNSRNGPLQLYAMLAQQPLVCQGLYLPTMPSDAFEMIAQVRPSNGSAFVPHACPNGHLYVITECGRAYTESSCPECGARIGGRNHQLDHQNRRVNARNNTRPGHSLGPSKNRPQFAAPERELSPISTALQRLLIHLSMLLGSLENGDQNIQPLIENTQVNNVQTFFGQHILLDFRILREIFGKNNEDVLLISHLFVKHLKDAAEELQGQHNNLTELRTSQDRARFEMKFHRILIEPFLQTYTKQLNVVKKLCVDDLRLGSDPLMRRLYEIGGANENQIANFNPMVSAQLWRYRQPISIGRMRMKLQEERARSGEETNRQLHEFLLREKLYIHLKELPKILQFHHLLHQTYKYKIDKRTAKEMSINELLQTSGPKEQEIRNELTKLYKTVTKVWNQISPFLSESGPFKPNEDFHPTQMDNKTKLEYLLCSDENAGRCLKSMITFLISLQNDFLGLYQHMDGAYVKLISIQDVKETSVISYNTQTDLLPIVYLHCDYSLEIGRGTQMEYNLVEIERRFMDKICYGKCLIEKSIELFKYRDEVHSAQQFINLGRKIDQVKIPQADQRGMMAELKQIDHVSNALKAVETAIGFIATHGGQPNQSYKEYLVKKIKYDPKVYLASKTMQTTLRLTHLCSTWLMLTTERAIRLFAPDRVPFTFGEHHNLFMVPIKKEMFEQCQEWLPRFDKHLMMGILTEYMVCELPTKRNNDGDMELHEALDLYTIEKNEKMEKTSEQSGDVLKFDEWIPNELQLQNIYSYWCIVAKAYRRN